MSRSLKNENRKIFCPLCPHARQMQPHHLLYRHLEKEHACVSHRCTLCRQDLCGRIQCVQHLWAAHPDRLKDGRLIITKIPRGEAIFRSKAINAFFRIIRGSRVGAKDLEEVYFTSGHWMAVPGGRIYKFPYQTYPPTSTPTPPLPPPVTQACMTGYPRDHSAPPSNPQSVLRSPNYLTSQRSSPMPWANASHLSFHPQTNSLDTPPPNPNTTVIYQLTPAVGSYGPSADDSFNHYNALDPQEFSVNHYNSHYAYESMDSSGWLPTLSFQHVQYPLVPSGPSSLEHNFRFLHPTDSL